MNISTRGRYGLRAIVDLAQHSGENKPVTLSAIAKRQDISEGYLEQLMVQLKKSTLVKSVRGAQGGYVLAKAPKDITVGQVLNVLEGPVQLVACVGDIDNCNRAENCTSRRVWEELASKINEVLESYTVWDLVTDQDSLI